MNPGDLAVTFESLAPDGQMQNYRVVIEGAENLTMAQLKERLKEISEAAANACGWAACDNQKDSVK